MMMCDTKLCISVFLILLAKVAIGEQWSEGFESGLGGAKLYRENPPSATLENVAANAAEGKQFVRASLPGKSRLEGFNVTATGLSGGRLATVTAKVRGQGRLWLCLISGNGWLYSPQTVRLTNVWQEVSLSKALLTRDKSLGIHFLSRDVQTDAVFEVDEVRVSLSELPQVFDVEVGPWRLEAEDFTTHQTSIAEDTSASGGKIARQSQYVRLAGLPFPRTSRDVTVYLRVKPGFAEEDYRLVTTQGGNDQSLSVVKPGKPGIWQWLRFPPATAGEVGDTFEIEMLRQKSNLEPSSLDAIVLSTHPDLDDAALAKTPPLFSPRPLALVARAITPPDLDGKGDEACWRSSVACTDFMQVRSLIPTERKTTTRLCYDDANLYLLFVSDEPILGVAQQRRHEFVTNVKQRDGNVYEDDSCLVLLDPTNTGKQVFDFTINGLGTVADARCPGPDLWETRDISWNSGAKAVANVGDGVWTVEMAIPFSDLTGRTPKAGEVWQVCLARIAKARKEQSSWNPSNRGFHDPLQFGALVFAETTAGVTLAVPKLLQLGKTVVEATIDPSAGKAGGVYLTSSVRDLSGVKHSTTFASIGKALAKVTHPIEVAKESSLQIGCGVLDAATLQPLYLSPFYDKAVKTTVATIALACDGPYELFLNEEVIARGQEADAIDIKAPLQRGPNVFALKLERGTAAVKISAPGVEGSNINWRMNDASVKDATAITAEDGGWKVAPKVGEHPKMGAIIGEPAKAMVLRHTLLWEKTRVWPTPTPALYIARNSNQHLTFIADGLAGRALQNWTVYLAVPESFEIIGSTGYYGNVSYQPHFVCTQLGAQIVAGRKMRVARITADKPILTGRHFIFSLFNVFVRYQKAAGDPKETETSFVYWGEGNDRTIIEAPQVIPIRLLPPLKGLQPKKLVLQLWGSFFGEMDDAVMRKATLETMRDSGFNDVASGERWTSDVGPAYGVANTMGVNFAAWCLNLQPYLKDHPDERLITREGKPSDQFLCMSLMLKDSWSAVESKLRERMDRERPQTVDFDYEYPPFDGPQSCYCPRCLAAFREHARLSADSKVDAATIKEQYGAQWVDFISWRVAQMLATFKDAVHRITPGTKFSAYSGYQTPDNAETYGLDWRYVGRLQACDRVGCGYGRPVQYLPATLEALAGIPAIYGALVTPYNTTETVPQTPATKALLLRLSLDSTGGVLVYDRLPIDGRTWFAVSETTRIVATFEDLFLAGKRSALPPLDEALVQVLTDGKLTLVCAMNGGSSQVEYSLQFPANAGSGAEFYSGRKVAAGETVKCVLLPGEAAVFVLRLGRPLTGRT